MLPSVFNLHWLLAYLVYLLLDHVWVDLLLPAANFKRDDEAGKASAWPAACLGGPSVR